MQKNTHLVFAILLFFITNFIFHLQLYMSLFTVIGAVTPDIDIKFKSLHRKIFHNAWFLLIILFFSFMYSLIDKNVAIAFSIGFASHLIADSLTIKGIMPLWPITTPKFSGPIKTGGLSELAIMLGITFILFKVVGLL